MFQGNPTNIRMVDRNQRHTTRSAYPRTPKRRVHPLNFFTRAGPASTLFMVGHSLGKFVLHRLAFAFCSQGKRMLLVSHPATVGWAFPSRPRASSDGYVFTTTSISFVGRQSIWLGFVLSHSSFGLDATFATARLRLPGGRKQENNRTKDWWMNLFSTSAFHPFLAIRILGEGGALCPSPSSAIPSTTTCIATPGVGAW